MEIQNIIRGVKPIGGEVVPIRTVQETRPVEEFGMIYNIGILRHQRLT
jgi:tRNA-specific adenosine deaminase 3